MSAIRQLELRLKRPTWSAKLKARSLGGRALRCYTGEVGTNLSPPKKSPQQLRRFATNNGEQ